APGGHVGAAELDDWPVAARDEALSPEPLCHVLDGTVQRVRLPAPGRQRVDTDGDFQGDVLAVGQPVDPVLPELPDPALERRTGQVVDDDAQVRNGTSQGNHGI